VKPLLYTHAQVPRLNCSRKPPPDAFSNPKDPAMSDATPASAPALPKFADALMRLWPNGDEKIPGLRAGMIASAPAVFAKYGITTPLLVAHVMAQGSLECGAGHEVIENLSYSAQRA